MNTTYIEKRIRVLPALLIDRIAAGEVIEGPSSVIKELIENSIDAKANKIEINTKAAGTTEIFIIDNGAGIHPQDLETCITRYATSKIFDLNDLENLSSFGFRGEALAAISSVCDLHIKSKISGELLGSELYSRGGKIIKKNPCQLEVGTQIKVSDLFYCTPARRKFLKSERSENQKNYKEIIQLALAYPHCHFKYSREDKNYLEVTSSENLIERIKLIFGNEIYENLIEVNFELDNIKVWGFISQPDFSRTNRDLQFTFVNNRPIEIKYLSYMVKKAYDELLVSGANPVFFLHFDIPSNEIDVNVHPQKKEIRLTKQNFLQSNIYKTLYNLLRPRTILNFQSLSSNQNLKNLSLTQNNSMQGVLINEPFSKVNAIENVSIDKLKKITHSNFENTDINKSEIYKDFNNENNIENLNNKNFENSDINKNEIYKDLNNENEIENLNNNSLENYDINKSEIYKDFNNENEIENININNLENTDINNIFGETKPINENSFFTFKRHYGIFFGTYILAQDDNNLYFIDQHTAHERINYEKYLNLSLKNKTQRQILLTPINVECLQNELESIKFYQNILEENGFIIELSGLRSYFIREVPNYVEEGEEKNILQKLIQKILDITNIEEVEKKSNLNNNLNLEIYKDYCAMRACKASVKKNDFFSDKLITEILNDLGKCIEPTRCPHGRPTIVKISNSFLDKIFKRI